jgi:hypothetical protein
MGARITQPQAQLDPKLMDEITTKMIVLLRELKSLSQGRENEVVIARELRSKLEAILYLPIITSHFQRLQPGTIKEAAEYLHKQLTDSNYIWGTLFSWLFVHALGAMVNPKDFAAQSRLWIDDWRLDRTILDVLNELGLDEATTRRVVALVKLLTRHQRWFEATSSDTPQAYAIMESLFKDREVAEFLRMNQYHDLWWFHKESFEEMLWWLMIVAALEIGSDPLRPVNAVVKELQGCYSMIQTWQQAEEQSDYQVEKMLEVVRGL